MVIQKTLRPPLIAPKKNKNEHRTAAVDVAATQEGPALAGKDIVEVCRCVGKGRMHGGGGGRAGGRGGGG